MYQLHTPCTTGTNCEVRVALVPLCFDTGKSLHWAACISTTGKAFSQLQQLHHSGNGNNISMSILWTVHASSGYLVNFLPHGHTVAVDVEAYQVHHIIVAPHVCWQHWFSQGYASLFVVQLKFSWAHKRGSVKSWPFDPGNLHKATLMKNCKTKVATSGNDPEIENVFSTRSW